MYYKYHRMYYGKYAFDATPPAPQSGRYAPHDKTLASAKQKNALADKTGAPGWRRMSTGMKKKAFVSANQRSMVMVFLPNAADSDSSAQTLTSGSTGFAHGLLVNL